jgi:uncharacterized lipoprotein YddW (UPF0748 family)
MIELQPVFVAHFDQSIIADKPQDLVLESKGGAIIPDGISGSAVRLNKNEYVAIDASKVISGQEGTLMLWVRPHWSSGNEPSHAFVSFEWMRGYFVLSDGWWEEGGGRPFTYFIFNNRDSEKTEKKIGYLEGKWIHLACTWKVGREGFIYLYANGLMTALSYKIPQISENPKGKIYFGIDKGTPLEKERWADCDFDEMAIYNRAFSDEEILSIYNQQNPTKTRLLRDSKDALLETRAIFDEGTGWMTRSGAEETIRKIKKAGFNVYIPCVWHGMGTRYPSQLAPAEKNEVSLDDPLEYLIRIAHENHIEVHPWFTVTLRQREFLKQFYEPGTPNDAFNIHRPEFRTFIVNLMLDVIERYDVDGINLDFIRTQGICKSDFCRNQYNELYHRNLAVDLKQKCPDGRLNRFVQEWVDKSVAAVVRGVSKQVREKKPGIIFSVDGYPMLRQEPPNPEGRQEIAWANEGLIDLIFNMDYKKSPDFDRLEAVSAELQASTRVIPLLANYEWKTSKTIISRKGPHLAELLKYSRNRVPYGFGIYIYSMLDDDQLNSLSQLYNSPSLPFWKPVAK